MYGLAFLRGRRARKRELERRRAYVEGYAFPSALRAKVSEHYPELSDRELTTVLEGLRAWFLACLHAGGKTLGMPSRAIDVAWHEFILLTRDYHAFCDEAFGHYLHHSPAVAMDEPMDATLARTVSVLDRHPGVASQAGLAALPFLFVIDTQLGIEGGNRWTERPRRATADRRHGRRLRGGLELVGRLERRRRRRVELRRGRRQLRRRLKRDSRGPSRARTGLP